MIIPERIRRPRKDLVIFGTVKGLVEDAGQAEMLYRETVPSAIGLHISPEEMKGLKAVASGKVKEVPLSSYEMVYAKKLSAFGEVQVPSPSLVKVLKLAQEDGVETFSLDMDDEKYAEVYTRNINGLSMVRTSLRLKRVNRKKFRSGSAEEFCMEWDRTVNSRPYLKLEAEREKHIAKAILRRYRKEKPLLAIVELERIDGIVRAIEQGT